MDRLASMEAFARVVETSSFTAAARQLNLGQPAVSKAVAQLERRLGIRLLMRSTRRLMPTEAGQNFYERARRAIEEANEAELAARGVDKSLTGRLRVRIPGKLPPCTASTCNPVTSALNCGKRWARQR